MSITKEELFKCFDILELNTEEKDTITLEQASASFGKLVLIVHPDKAGYDQTANFQRLREAYEKVRNYFKETNIPSTERRNFFDDNFELFNFPHENKGSFTVKIQDSLAHSWNECITTLLGSPFVKKNIKGTETDRYWKVEYEQKEITLHLYILPKNRKGSKLLVQGSDQGSICAYVFNELPVIYSKVCEGKVKAIKVDKNTKSSQLVTCDQCKFKSSIIQMKIHIRNYHNTKST